jgi:hypothetical protein
MKRTFIEWLKLGEKPKVFNYVRYGIIQITETKEIVLIRG